MVTEQVRYMPFTHIQLYLEVFALKKMGVEAMSQDTGQSADWKCLRGLREYMQSQVSLR